MRAWEETCDTCIALLQVGPELIESDNGIFIGSNAMRHLLIIASDPVKAERLVETCRRVHARVSYTPDPIHGLIQAMHDEPAMLLIDADDAWLGDVSVIQEVRRHPNLCFTPVMLITEARTSSLGNRSVEHGADYVVDLDCRNLGSRIRACYSHCGGESDDGADCKASLLARLAAKARRAANSVSLNLSATTTARRAPVVAIGDLMCDGNLFRRIGAARLLYELQIARDTLWLMPIQRGLAPFCFKDTETLLENFQFMPFA